MDGKLVRLFAFASFISLVILLGSAKSFAETPPSSDKDNSSDNIDDRENKTQEAIDQLQDEGMGDNPKQEQALERSLNQIDEQTAAAEADAMPHEAPVKKVPVPAASVPVQQAPAAQEAVTQTASPVQEAPIVHSPGWKFDQVNQFDFAPEFSYIEYKEPGLMHEKGPFVGVYGAYYSRLKEYRAYPINVFHIDAHLNFGLVDYKGTGEINDIHDYLFEPRTWLGKDFDLGPNAHMTPYAGLGYRFLWDSLSKGDGGYDRRSQYFYVPIGVETRYQLPDDWQVGLNGEYDILIRGWQTSYLSNVNPLYPDVNNVQHSGYGLRGSLDFTKQVGRFTFTLSPYVRYWNIKRSATAIALSQYYEVVGDEPNNHSTEIGFRFRMEF